MNIFFTRAMPAILLGLCLSLAGCGSSKKKVGGGEDAADYDSGDEQREEMVLEANGDSDSGKAGALQTVHFDYDSSQLTATTRSILDDNAKYLQENSSIEIQVEGHCDERGGVEHNLALGERRAKVVKTYLGSAGVESSRINTISYGKEKPLEFGHDESAWSRNRRANFVILAK